MDGVLDTAELNKLGGGVQVFKKEEGVVRKFSKQVEKAGKTFNIGDLCLPEFKNRIGALEHEFGEDLTNNEKAVLSLFSQMFSLVAWKNEIGDLENASDDERTEYMEESVILQQEVVEIVTNNVDLETGEFSKPLARYFLFLTDTFGDLMTSDCVDMRENARLVEGIRGMVTSAFLFKGIGWEVSLPPVEFDVFYGVDLMVRNPDTGKYYAVDVTASLHDKPKGEDVFEFKKANPHFKLKTEESWSKVGFLRLNVPPIKDSRGGLLPEAKDFYVSKGGLATRSLGIPNEKSLNMFKDLLKGYN